MTAPDPAEFRAKIAEQLAHESPWGRHVALYGPDPALAKALGVTNDLLNRAAFLVREGFGAKNKSQPLEKIRMRLPIEIGRPLQYLGAEMGGRSRTELMRDLMHAVMQLPQEPTPKAAETGRRTVVFRGKRVSTKYVWDWVLVSKALKGAVGKRATAYGATVCAYVRFWVIDLIEGRLGHVDIPAVLMAQMFDRSDAYVLPAPPKG